MCQGVGVWVRRDPVTGLCARLGCPLPGLGISLLSGPVVLHSLFQGFVGDKHSFTHFSGATIRHWGQVGVGHGSGELMLLFGGGTRVRVVGGAVGTEGRSSQEAGDGKGLHLLAVAFGAGTLTVAPWGVTGDDCGGLRGKLQ